MDNRILRVGSVFRGDEEVVVSARSGQVEVEIFPRGGGECRRRVVMTSSLKGFGLLKAVEIWEAIGVSHEDFGSTADSVFDTAVRVAGDYGWLPVEDGVQ
jgi:hypothetical protein